ncbi:MAG: PEP-CTERM sorting domain-containing protein [Armatimonadota bacterium]|nr:PEP-CTERM sorting domain-containing protein [Armatimonadota bacterium]
MKGVSGAGTASDGYNSTGFSASAAASSTTWLSVKLQSSLMAGQTGNHSKVSVRDSAGTELYRIWMNSGRAYFQALAGGAQEGGTFTFTDTTWHSFDMVYNSGTGALNAYVDGSLSWSAATSLTTGLTANTVYVYSYGWGPQDDVYMDEVWIGAGAGPPVVPEPSSLLAFGVFGISAFGFIRRRRA